MDYKLTEISEIKSDLAADIKKFRENLEQKMEAQYEKCENEKIYEAKLEEYFKMKALKVQAFAISFEPYIRLIDKEASCEENYGAESLLKDWLRAKGDMTKMLAIIYQLERGYALCLRKADEETIVLEVEGNENTH